MSHECPIGFIDQHSNLVGRVGLEPTTKGLCVPLRLSPPVSGLRSGLYLAFTAFPSSLYTFPLQGFARYWHSGLATLAATEFAKFYPEAELTYLRATH